MKYNNISIDTTLNEEDITDLERFKKITKLELEEGDDFDCYVTGQFLPFIPATYYEPAEGGYCDDICIYVNDKDVTELILDNVFGGLESELTDNIPSKHDLY